MPLLDESDINLEIENLPEWNYIEKTITKAWNGGQFFNLSGHYSESHRKFHARGTGNGPYAILGPRSHPVSWGPQRSLGSSVGAPRVSQRQ